MSRMLRGADIVAQSLNRLGCRRVFTLSGNHIMSIFDAALDADLDLVHVRHEAAADGPTRFAFAFPLAGEVAFLERGAA